MLASLLDCPRGRGAFLVRAVMADPWSFLLDDDAPLGLVAVVAGEAWAAPDAALGEPVRLTAGSLILAKGPRPLVLGSGLELMPTLAFGPDGRCTTPDGEELDLDLGVRTWGNDPAGRTRMIMGCFRLRGEFSARVLDALPPLAVLPPDASSAPLVGLLDEEIGRDDPGQPAVLDRVFDLLLVTAIRAWFRDPAQVPSWYAVFGDPVVGPAVRMLHEEPGLPWTVASLAAATGHSRSALARHFTERLGMPPMAYLKERRLARAADLLLDPDLTLDAIARRVGYADGPALSTAFKGARGVSPQQYRAAGLHT